MKNLNGVSVNEVIKNEPLKILEWVRNIKSDKISQHKDFNWLGLAEVSTSRAQRDYTNKNSLLWAKVAVEVYDFLLKNDYQEGYYYSMMNLKIYFIKRLGPVKNDMILDLDKIVQDFFESLTMSLDEVKKLSDNWIKLNIDKIRELRRIKNRLTRFKGLDIDILKLYPEILKWIEIQNKLP